MQLPIMLTKNSRSVIHSIIVAKSVLFGARVYFFGSLGMFSKRCFVYS